MLTEKLTTIASTALAEKAIGSYMRDSGARTPEDIAGLGKNNQTGPGALRRNTNRLSESVAGKKDSIREGQFIGSTFRLIFGSKVPYAATHEQGFSGTVNVPQHTRNITQAFGRKIAPTQVTVSAHNKNMRIPKRPYLVPALEDQEDYITNEITRRVYNLILSL